MPQFHIGSTFNPLLSVQCGLHCSAPLDEDRARYEDAKMLAYISNGKYVCYSDTLNPNPSKKSAYRAL